MDRKTTFVLALVYLIVILAVGLLFFVKRDLLFLLPQTNFFGSVPVGVPWFGALGAVLISLTGVFEHEHDWDASYWPWHVARPLVGVAVGVVSVLIMQAGVLAVGSTPIQPGSTPTVSPAKIPTNLLYYLVAFLVGYREETFRELIKRLVDIILAPGNGKTAGPTIQAVNPTSAPHGTATQVTITGSGFASTQSVKFGGSAAQFTVNGDGKLTVTTPVMQAGGTVALAVATKSGSASIDFTFS
jgi:hypothetical protein